MTYLERQAKAERQFHDLVMTRAREAGAAIATSIVDGEKQEFILPTFMGPLRGGAVGTQVIYMRFLSPGEARPGVAKSDFNPYSHKWNIQNSPTGANALKEFDRRLAWINARELAATPP